MKVTFPNESFPTEILFKWNEFKVERLFDDVVFGWYGDIYVKISRKDYEKKVDYE